MDCRVCANSMTGQVGPSLLNPHAMAEPSQVPSHRAPAIEHPIYVAGFHGLQLNGVPMEAQAVDPAFAVGHGGPVRLSRRQQPSTRGLTHLTGLAPGGVDVDGEEIGRQAKPPLLLEFSEHIAFRARSRASKVQGLAFPGLPRLLSSAVNLRALARPLPSALTSASAATLSCTRLQDPHIKVTCLTGHEQVSSDDLTLQKGRSGASATPADARLCSSRLLSKGGAALPVGTLVPGINGALATGRSVWPNRCLAVVCRASRSGGCARPNLPAATPCHVEARSGNSHCFARLHSCQSTFQISWRLGLRVPVGFVAQQLPHLDTTMPKVPGSRPILHGNGGRGTCLRRTRF